MIRLFFALHHRIVNLSIHGFTQNWLKYFRDHPLLYGTSVLQTKGHHLIAKYFSRGDEYSFVLIRLVHGYLVVTSVCIQEAHLGMTLVDQSLAKGNSL